MQKEPLERKATVGLARRLQEEGLLTDEAVAASIGALRPPSAWYQWARRMLLILGSALILAGIIFFFAYNWSQMHRLVKLGIIEGGIVACIIVVQIKGVSRLSGKILLACSSVLVGVLLAVYGQIYQTGADAFELFVGWGVLIVGWVVISDLAGLWLIWLIILNVGSVLYWAQVGKPSHSISYEWLCLFLAALNCAALVLREIGTTAKLEWLKGKWLRGVLVVAVFLMLSIPTVNFIMGFEKVSGLTTVSSLIWLLSALGGYLFYRHLFRDMVALALITMNVCAIILTILGKILFEISDGPMTALLMALIIIMVASGATIWLRKTASVMEAELSKGDA